MKKSKTKSTVKKSPAKRTGLRKNYESHWLAVILVSFLLLEGFLGTSTSMQDWQQGVAVLDVSSSVAQTATGVAIVFHPMTDAIDGVNQFYSIAATEMASLLDLSGDDSFGQISLVYDGVNDFYQQASVQMISVLDMSSVSSWPSRVAGVSIVAH